MHIVDTIAEWLDRLTPLFSVVLALFSWVTGVIHSKLATYLKSRKMDQLLSIKVNEACEVILPVREGTLEQCFGNGNRIKTTFDTEYIPFEESKVLLILPHLLKTQDIRLVKGKGDVSKQNNKFCIGGFQANEYVREMLRGNLDYKFKGSIFRGSSEATLNHPVYQFCRDFLKPRDKDHCIYVGTSDQLKEYKYDEKGDYIVWIKISSKTVGQKKHGTIHIIWGDRTETAEIMLKYILENSSFLYRQLKKNHHLNHHCVLLRCLSTKEIDTNSFCDFTDEMFYPFNSNSNK